MLIWFSTGSTVSGLGEVDFRKGDKGFTDAIKQAADEAREESG